MDSIHYPLSISRLDYSRICFGDWDGLKPTSHQSEQLRPNGRLSWQRTWWTFGDLAMWGSSSHNATYYKSISNYIILDCKPSISIVETPSIDIVEKWSRYMASCQLLAQVVAKAYDFVSAVSWGNISRKLCAKGRRMTWWTWGRLGIKDRSPLVVIQGMATPPVIKYIAPWNPLPGGLDGKII